jgi:hypothetical protein
LYHPGSLSVPSFFSFYIITVKNRQNQRFNKTVFVVEFPQFPYKIIINGFFLRRV